jgi:NAD(P)-dependent dehydrogenase (short-subunit alcohol dehydrogenase family)
MFEALEQAFGGLEVLINNAGIAGPTGPIETLDPAAWRRCVAVNLDGAFLCARRAVPLLKAAGGGAVVNISSTAGLMGYPLRTPYAAAKWAVIGLTKSLATS